MIDDRVLGLLVEMTVANHHLHAPDTEIKECHHDLCERARIVVLDHARVVVASKDVEAT